MKRLPKVATMREIPERVAGQPSLQLSAPITSSRPDVPRSSSADGLGGADDSASDARSDQLDRDYRELDRESSKRRQRKRKRGGYVDEDPELDDTNADESGSETEDEEEGGSSSSAESDSSAPKKRARGRGSGSGGAPTPKPPKVHIRSAKLPHGCAWGRAPFARPTQLNTLMNEANRVAAWDYYGIVRKHAPFAREVYGEVLSPFVRIIIKELRLTKDDVFLDVGCGWGNVVFQVAALVGCRAVGVEVRKDLHEASMTVLPHFERLMKENGIKAGQCEFHCGDAGAGDWSFERFNKIFMNNSFFDFAEDTSQQLLDRFKATLRRGAQRAGARYLLSLQVGLLTLRHLGTKYKPHSGYFLNQVLPQADSPLQIFRWPFRHFRAQEDVAVVSWTTKRVDGFVYVVDRNWKQAGAGSAKPATSRSTGRRRRPGKQPANPAETEEAAALALADERVLPAEEAEGPVNQADQAAAGNYNGKPAGNNKDTIEDPEELEPFHLSAGPRAPSEAGALDDIDVDQGVNFARVHMQLLPLQQRPLDLELMGPPWPALAPAPAAAAAPAAGADVLSLGHEGFWAHLQTTLLAKRRLPDEDAEVLRGLQLRAENLLRIPTDVMCKLVKNATKKPLSEGLWLLFALDWEETAEEFYKEGLKWYAANGREDKAVSLRDLWSKRGDPKHNADLDKLLSALESVKR
eukprot:tig00021521_g22066.t1